MHQINLKIPAMILLAGVVTGALTAGSFGVYTSTSGGGQGCGSSWAYNTTNGGGGGESTNPGNISVFNCSNTFTGSVTPGLTTGNSQAQQFADSGGGPVNSSQSATADLSSASLHAISTTNGFYGDATAELWDTLTFSIPGATDSTVTNINMFFGADGSITAIPDCTHTDGNCQARSAALQLTSGGVGCGGNVVPGICTHASLADWAWSGGEFTGETDNSGLVTWDVLESTASDYLVEGTVSLVGANPVFGLVAALEVDPVFGAEDYSNTADISFQLPDGVTFTSDSGTFDVAPEPSTLALGVLALAAALICSKGASRRRLRP